MKFKKLATLLVAAAVAIGGISVSPAQTEAATVTMDGYSYSSEVVDALNHVNDIRSKMGLSAVKLNPFLTKAAENHVNYLTSNGVTGHTEDSGKKGYTGYRIGERLSAVGYSNDNAGAYEIISYNDYTIVEAIDEFLDTAYHRTPIVSVATESIGFAIEGKTVVGISATYEDNQVGESMYPYNGQTGVGLSFEGFENPNPLDQFGVNKSGYILSLEVGGAALNETNSKVVFTSSSGKPLSTFIFGDLGTLFILPKEVLNHSTTYNVSVTYTPSYGPYMSQTSTKTWTFTTAAQSSPARGPATTPKRDNSQPTSTIPAIGNGSSIKYTKDNIAVKINKAIVSVNPKPILKSGSTFIPLRGVLENLGASLTYNSKTKGISIVQGSTNISLTIGSTKAYVNGKAVTLSTAPFVSATGSTFVPLRFVSQALGASVGWDQKNYIVSIDTK
ncbi:stalk domain-containing protein [Paenibacillus donghaensis]|uniref:SCP domain-containing protein n=1 Tax=Paenibacillus donghaensis TaxID=414771 RepID=A0A2Z2KHC0_9BACL|nr:stalk domain-containing protein [Paenibacillus donghaensis]ASA25634.1 hypothetical protein B9T62_35825 [Paenibacillus donghaensis]